MKLLRVKIENFRSIKSESFDLGAFALLVGANDHGKTNIMKAINAFFNLNISENGALLEKGFYKINKRRDSGPSPLRISVVIGSLPPGLRHTKKKLTEIGLTIQFLANDSIKFSFNSLRLDRPTTKHSPKAMLKYKEIIKHFKVSYVPTFRNIEDQLSPFAKKSVLFDMLSNYLMDTMQREQGGTTYEYRTVKKIKNSIDTLLEESFDDIKEATKKYLPSSFGKSEFSFSFIGNESDESRDRKISEIISKNTFILNSTNGENVYELGSGIQQAVTIGLLEKTCLVKNKSNILLLEEPETFLHPNAQRELFVKLSALSKKPATQMIFSTHSSPILDATDLDKICVVRKHKNHMGENEGTRVLQVQNTLAASVKKTIEEVELKKTFENSDVFFSELVIFVEGFTDELVLKEVIKKLAPELLYRVSVVNCHGNSKFLPMTKFLDSFKSTSGAKIKWVIVTDKDSHTRDVHKDFTSLASTEKIDWEMVKTTAQKKTSVDQATGLVNRNVAKLIANKINRDTKKCKVFTLESDIEFSIVTPNNLHKVSAQIKNYDAKGEATLQRFVGVDKIATLIGSKGPNFDWGLDDNNRKRWKRAELHRSIVSVCTEEEISDELNKLVTWIKEQLK